MNKACFNMALGIVAIRLHIPFYMCVCWTLLFYINNKIGWVEKETKHIQIRIQGNSTN